MRIFAIICIVLLMATTVNAKSITRQTETEAEGRIDYHLIAENEEATTATKLTGDGTVKSQSDIHITKDTLTHEQQYLLHTDDSISVTGRPYKSLEFISGLYVDDDVYAILLKVKGGQVGKIDLDYTYLNKDVDQIDNFKVDTFATVTEGIYRRYVNLQDDEISLREVFELVGSGEFKDWLRWKPVINE